MAFTSKIRTLYQIRSISLPCRSHPSTDKIEVELNKLKSFDMSSSSSSCAPNSISIINGLSQLEGLYRCFGEFLNLGLTQEALSHNHQCDRYIDDIQEKFVSLLDICGAAKDFVSQMKEFHTDIQSSLRRIRRGDRSSIEGVALKYRLCKKNLKKKATKLVSTFKNIDNDFSTIQILGFNDHVSSIIRVLREVFATTISIFQSVIQLLCDPFWKPKTRRSMVSKLLHKETCENQIEELNELQILDKAWHQLFKNDSTEDIENGMESLYRELIKTRVYLLNIGSSML